MAQQDRKFERKFDPGREVGSENRKDVRDRPADEMQFEVAQRTAARTDAHENKGEHTRASAPSESQTSGYGNREDRENPGKGLAQSGTRQSHELPGEGTRVGDDERKNARAMSQNAARISDFEDRPSR
jgi:hypothetical protein